MSIVSHTTGNTLPSEESATESIELEYYRDRVQQGVRHTEQHGNLPLRYEK